MRLATPPGFNFWRTVRSHGWYALPPFSIDEERRLLRRVLLLSPGDPVTVEASGLPDAAGIRLTADREISAPGRELLRRQMSSCLRLDEDFRPFHRLARASAATSWIARSGSGRLLRAPTVFEDLVKMLCTTNCTWALTTIMVSNLVDAFGSPSNGGAAFPSADEIAATTEARLRREIKAGYRAPFLLRLAEDVAAGRRDVEAWRDSAQATSALYREITEVKGAGAYAAGNLLKLLGRYEHLGLDSWVRARFADLYHAGRRVSDRTIERRYAPFGEWRGLVFWLEMTRSWHEEKFPARKPGTHSSVGGSA
jgi:N-glycosylase/DNA lyase